jgi:hypothetical protein
VEHKSVVAHFLKEENTGGSGGHPQFKLERRYSKRSKRSPLKTTTQTLLKR